MSLQNHGSPYGMANHHITFRAVQLFQRAIEIENAFEERNGVAIVPATSAEYQTIRAELGEELRLGPQDLHPLDLTFDNEWTEGDPRIPAWVRAANLRRELFNALLERICWWHSPRWSGCDA
jgi:hypothetical protein